MLLSSLIVLVMACVLLAAVRSQALHRSAVRVRTDND